MPLRWYSGSTETGPSPYQFMVPSEMFTGENAICPTTRPSTSATNDMVKAFADCRASMMNCSVWLLISMVLNAAMVTSEMAAISVFVSSLITIFCVVIGISFHGVVWPTLALSGVSGRVLVRRFLWPGCPNTGKVSRVACSQLAVVRACLSEAESTIRPASDNVGIVLVLTVVLPEADGADLESATLTERPAETAWTAKRQVGRRPIGSRGVVVEPRHSTSQFLRRRFACRVFRHRRASIGPTSALSGWRSSPGRWSALLGASF
jgi:hypothetical protein